MCLSVFVKLIRASGVFFVLPDITAPLGFQGLTTKHVYTEKSQSQRTWTNEERKTN